MKNSDLRSKIEWSLRRVPRKDGFLKYIPLHQLPTGTQILIETDHYLKEDEPRNINGRAEIDVIGLKSGVYGLQMDIWPTMSLSPFKGHTVPLKAFYTFLTPGAILQGNIDLPVDPRGHNDPWAITYRLASGIITKITIPDTDFVLKDDKCLHIV